MGNRQVLILAGVLATLLVVAWFAGVFGDQPSTVQTQEWELATETIEGIEITQSGQPTIRATLDNSGWRLQSPVTAAADTAAIRRFIEQLSDLETKRVVSSSPDRFASYGVDSNSVRVSVNEGRTTKTLRLGRAGTEPGTRYGRINDSNDVLAFSGTLSLPASVDDWRDKTLLSFPADQLESVAVDTPEGAYLAVSDAGTWKIEDQGTRSDADSLEVSLWVNRLSRLRSDGFLADSLAKSVADSSTHNLTVTMKDGSVRKLRVRKMEGHAAALLDGGLDIHRLLLSSLPSAFPTPGRLRGEE